MQSSPKCSKTVAKFIAKVIFTLSSYDIFDKSILIYQHPLCQSGFKEELKYTPSGPKSSGRKQPKNKNKKNSMV